MDRIILRYRDFLLSGADLAPVALPADGRWADVDYQSRSQSNWPPAEHLVRMNALARAYHTNASPFYQQSAVKVALTAALDAWVQARPTSTNWWYMEIGAPRQMRDFLALFFDQLCADRQSAALSVLAQYRVANTGANLTWSADLALHHAALTHNVEAVRAMAKRLPDEICIGTGEGVQPDFSFHQHGEQLQQFHYGESFLSDNIRLAWQLHGTPWAFAPEKIDLLANCVLSGSQWMLRGAYTVPGTLDRAVSRPGTLCQAKFAKVVDLLAQIDPPRSAQYAALADRLQGQGTPLVGHRYFPRSDLAAYHRPGFSFFLKTRSSRTLKPEVNYNDENLKGHLLGSGDAYVMSRGDEYFDLMPAWDWDLLPGVTFAKTTDGQSPALVEHPFTGSASNGQSGITAMAYAHALGDRQLSARKTWCMHGDSVICLIGQLTATAGFAAVRTAVDQCRLMGDVSIGLADGDIRTAICGTETIEHVHWVHHNGIAYIFPGGATLTLTTGPARGRWSDVATQQSRDEVVADIFLLVIEHGQQPAGQSMACAIVPCASPGIAHDLRANWTVLRNDADCQAIDFGDGTRMAAFFAPGQIGSGANSLAVDKPCVAILSADKISLADPAHIGGALNVTIANNRRATPLPADGTTISFVR